MARNKTQKKYKKMKGKGGVFSVPSKRPSTKKTISNTKTKKNVSFKATPDIVGESPEEMETCYNCYRKSDKRNNREALRDEATELGIPKKEIEYWIDERFKEKSNAKRKNKKYVRETKLYYLNRKEQMEKERLLQEFIGQVRK
tara:strand:+ start:88 stop:516 length:429 start_codon:yes stop_codon:yes gene_type:complete